MTYWMPWYSDFPITLKDASGVWDEGYPLFASQEEALAYAVKWNGGYGAGCHAERCVVT